MIQVINRAFDILEFIANDPEQPKALSDIAEATGLNQGTCANILKTMVSRRYVDQVGAKKGYTLGSKAYQLTGNEAYRRDIIKVARIPMAKLVEAFQETCVLAVLNGEKRQIIHGEYCNQPLQVQTSAEKNAYDSASGRLLISLLPDTELVRFKSRFGIPTPELWEEASTEPTFYHQVHLIRQQGYALQESLRQVIGYAVGIIRSERVIASLSMYLPLYRHTNQKGEQILESLQQAAKQIEEVLQKEMG